VLPKVFSKEILYDLIMAFVGRYPKLLEDDKGKLTKEQYKQYQKQLDLMVNLTMVYENEPENFIKIMKLICKIGRCGPLPSEVIDDISPGFDPSTMEQV
jgi:peroxin-19